jgi:hypothetical protein
MPASAAANEARHGRPLAKGSCLFFITVLHPSTAAGRAILRQLRPPAGPNKTQGFRPDDRRHHRY